MFWARGFFWLSALSIPASSVITITFLSRVLGAGQLATISAIFGLSFIGTVLPIGIQARSAADAAAHGAAASVRWKPVFVGTGIWIAVAPVLALVLRVPILAMLSPALGLIPSLIVGIGRGEMIGQQRFVAAAANHLVESSVRLIGGIGLGIWLGANGAALSLVACQLGAWALLPRRHGVAAGYVRLPSASVATALVILSIQVDLLIAPLILGGNASAYATAALPAKGVYLSLAATAWLVVPRAAACRRLKQAVPPLAATVAAGGVLSILFAFAAPWIGILLGQHTPTSTLVLGLGVGMALASGNWLLMQIRLARAQSRLWLAPGSAVALTVAVAVLVPTDLGLCVGIAIGQACALLVGLVQLQFGLMSDGGQRLEPRVLASSWPADAERTASLPRDVDEVATAARLGDADAR